MMLVNQKWQVLAARKDTTTVVLANMLELQIFEVRKSDREAAERQIALMELMEGHQKQKKRGEQR